MDKKIKERIKRELALFEKDLQNATLGGIYEETEINDKLITSFANDLADMHFKEFKDSKEYVPELELDSIQTYKTKIGSIRPLAVYDNVIISSNDMAFISRYTGFCVGRITPKYRFVSLKDDEFSHDPDYEYVVSMYKTKKLYVSRHIGVKSFAKALKIAEGYFKKLKEDKDENDLLSLIGEKV